MSKDNVIPLRVLALRAEAEAAADANDYDLRCSVGGEVAFYYAAPRAYVPGHIYSDAGMREFARVSRCCEWHYDQMFRDGDGDGDPP